MKVKYVCGFLFSRDGKYVVLIKKQRPEWQKGKLNGIGGKIEEGESALSAMQREFKEEAGIVISNWTPFCVLTGNDASYVPGGREFEVHFFSRFSDEAYNARTMEDEEVSYCTTDPMPNSVVPNLKWLIPLALERGLMAKVFDGINI